MAFIVSAERIDVERPARTDARKKRVVCAHIRCNASLGGAYHVMDLAPPCRARSSPLLSE